MVQSPAARAYRDEGDRAAAARAREGAERVVRGQVDGLRGPVPRRRVEGLEQGRLALEAVAELRELVLERARARRLGAADPQPVPPVARRLLAREAGQLRDAAAPSER